MAPERTYRLLPSFSDVIFVVVFFAALSGAGGSLFGDADTGYHIRAGEYVIENGEVPERDIFSSMSPPPEWTAHEWLAEVVFALIHGAAGLSGLAVFSAALIASVCALLFRLLRASGVGIVLSALVTILSAAASTIHWLARPHIFSLLFMVVWYAALEGHRLRGRGRLIFLPALMILWVNLHGGFVLGFVLLAVYMAALLPALLPGGDAGGREKLRRLALVTGLCLLAALVNPHGYKILLFPFKLANQRFIMDNVREWLSPDFHLGLAYEYMLLALIAVLGLSSMKLGAVETMLVLLFTHMSLYSARHIPLFAIIAAPVMGVRLEQMLYALRERRLAGFFLRKSREAAEMDSMAGGGLWPTLAVGALALLALGGMVDYGFDKKNVPYDAVRFLERERLSGNMFNSDEFGDYIIYAAWPAYRVFMDGRNDMYGEQRLRDYAKVVRLERGWEEVLRRHGVEWIIFETDSALSRTLLGGGGWRLVYADKVASVFVRSAGRNGALAVMPLAAGLPSGGGTGEGEKL